MSVTAKVDALAIAIANEINDVRTERGALTALSTTAKDSIVNAINEIFATIGGAAAIDDANTTLTTAWSSNKIVAELNAAISNITGGAAAGYDTFLELQQLMQADDTETTGILSSLAKRVAVDAAQTFTAAEQTQGRSNIGAASAADLGDEAAFNPVTTFNNALTA